MVETLYAIVDIETTGGSARLEKITEVAVILHDGKEITGEFVTLVNPERNIPWFITNITGITNEMVKDAPKFYEIARDIIELTEGRIMVAHNAKFDYSFLREEFKSLGYSYRRKLLDTVALCRKLFPGHRSYGLGNICRELGIRINDRHRAAGDAHATAKLFQMCLETDRRLDGKRMGITLNTRLAKLNPLLEASKVEQIPEEAGIYYFHDERGNIIYVGKSTNLYERVSSHLSNNTSGRAMEMRDAVADISWEVTGSELLALIRESFEIKSHKPLYNRAQRRVGSRWAIYAETNEDGYFVFSLRSAKGSKNHLALFSARESAKATLEYITEKYELCQKLSGLYETQGCCFHYQVGLCRGACCGKESPEEYNSRAARARDEFILKPGSYFIIDRGRHENERGAVKIVNSRYEGYGYFDIDSVGFGLDALHDCIIPSEENSDIVSIIKNYLNRNRVERIIEF